jgi:hypothetical protein
MLRGVQITSFTGRFASSRDNTPLEMSGLDIFGVVWNIFGTANEIDCSSPTRADSAMGYRNPFIEASFCLEKVKTIADGGH